MGEVKHDGGPAFPHGYSAQANSMPGMSLREWYAGQALAGMGTWCPGYQFGLTDLEGMKARAEWAYAQADAMLAARKATPPVNAFEANQAEIAKLREENERLREAMNQIAEMANWQIGVPTDTEAANEHARIAHTMAETARASALAKELTP